MSFIMFGVMDEYNLTATMSYITSVQMRLNYFYLSLLTGITLLIAPM